MSMENRPSLKISGINKEILQSVEERVSEFEQNHEHDLVKGGSGWVPRIKKVDYMIALDPRPS